MTTYIIRRLLYIIPIVFGVLLLTFVLFTLVGGDISIEIAGKGATQDTIDEIREEYGLNKPLFPALVKLPQAVRTFQEGERRTRTQEVGLKFGGIDSLLRKRNVAMGDDSIVRGSVSEGGSVWVVYNAGGGHVEFWIDPLRPHGQHGNYPSTDGK